MTKIKIPKTFRTEKDLDEKTKKLVDGAEKIKSEEDDSMYKEKLAEGFTHYMECRKEQDKKYVIIIKDSHYSNERFTEIGQKVIKLIFTFNDGKKPEFNIQNDSYPNFRISINQCYEMLYDSEKKDKFQVLYTDDHGLLSLIRDERLEKFIENTYIIEL
ncbi:MAG: hypothetical protein L6408_03285 [Nanoarchaeota archaeon]|nr:hypothetical protein [Nanoarchaeota archaeon]